MARLYANQIWKGSYDFNSTKSAYVKIKAQVIEEMRKDVADGKHTAEEFEVITGMPYEEVA